MDARTLRQNQKAVNSISLVVISATCGRCRQMRSRKGSWVFDFDVQQFLCAFCIASMEYQVLEDYRRASSLIGGDVA